MSQSTDAVLFYGYCWNDERPYPWAGSDDDDADADEPEKARYARNAGLDGPEEAWPDKTYDVNYTPEQQKIVNKYLKHWRVRDKLYAESGCEIGNHCSSDYSMPYIAVSESLAVSHRGDATKLAPEHFKVPQYWNRLLKDYCKIMKIKVGKKKPAWHLVSYWG